MSKLERLYQQITGNDPNRMEPKPTAEYMQKKINAGRSEDRKFQKADAPERYILDRGEDGDGVFTIILDTLEKKVAFKTGDHTRNPLLPYTLVKSDWLEIREGEDITVSV